MISKSTYIHIKCKHVYMIGNVKKCDMITNNDYILENKGLGSASNMTS